MSCLFNSMSHFFNEPPQQIRNKICDYLQENKPIIEGLETSEILQMESNNYIQNMRSPNTWGGAIEIQAACNIWNVQINVLNYRDGNRNGNNVIEFLPISRVDNTPRLIRVYWTGGHYEPIRE